MTELAPSIELSDGQRPRRLATLLSRLRERVEPPFPNAREYIGPEDNDFALTALRRILKVGNQVQ